MSETTERQPLWTVRVHPQRGVQYWGYRGCWCDDPEPHVPPTDEDVVLDYEATKHEPED